MRLFISQKPVTRTEFGHLFAYCENLTSEGVSLTAEDITDFLGANGKGIENLSQEQINFLAARFPGLVFDNGPTTETSELMEVGA